MEKTFTFSDGLKINRLGYGTMQLIRPGMFGPYKDEKKAVEVMDAVLNSSINFIDTADAYGPFFANLYVKKALENYQGQDKKMIATKVGFSRQGPGLGKPLGNPDYLRQQIELNLFSLGIKTIDLLQLHRVDPNYSISEQVSVLAEYKEIGKVNHIGLSQVTVAQIKEAQKVTHISSVQNRYNLINRTDEDVLKYCEENQIAFIPWYPLATGGLTGDTHHELNQIAVNHQAKPTQIALSWLLHKSPVILPIPGTSSIEHLHSNNLASEIILTDDEIAILDRMTL